MPFVDSQSPSAIDGGWIEGCIESADAEKAQLRQIPLFQYDPPKVGRSTYGAITVARYIFHQIEDMDAFYAAMGYNEAAKTSGLGGDEFIWDRYTRDGAKFSKHCLQVQFAAYLHKYSTKFKVLYGQTYAAMVGKCTSSDIDDNDQHCANCPMHPPRIAV